MTKEEIIICKVYLNDLDRTHDCNEYKLLMALLDREPCEDAVSREELKKWLDMNFSFGGASRKIELFDRLAKELSPVTPTRKKGKWKKENIGFMYDICSECGQRVTTGYFEYNYCPNCGAEMESE